MPTAQEGKWFELRLILEGNQLDTPRPPPSPLTLPHLSGWVMSLESQVELAGPGWTWSWHSLIMKKGWVIQFCFPSGEKGLVQSMHILWQFNKCKQRQKQTNMWKWGLKTQEPTAPPLPAPLLLDCRMWQIPPAFARQWEVMGRFLGSWGHLASGLGYVTFWPHHSEPAILVLKAQSLQPSLMKPGSQTFNVWVSGWDHQVWVASFLRWGNWSSEKLSSLSPVTKPVQVQGAWPQVPDSPMSVLVTS